MDDIDVVYGSYEDLLTSAGGCEGMLSPQTSAESIEGLEEVRVGRPAAARPEPRGWSEALEKFDYVIPPSPQVYRGASSLQRTQHLLERFNSDPELASSSAFYLH